MSSAPPGEPDLAMTDATILSAPAPAAPSLAAARRSASYKRYVLVALTAVHMWNLVDRSLVILLLESIKVDLHLSDTQLGFITGIAFGLFYALIGVPIARWADHGHRPFIGALAIGLWSLTVMVTALVSNYLQLVIARVAAAVGESGCNPPTYSLVGDYYPERVERTRAMAVYMTASPLAALASFALGGRLNDLYGWRATFFIMGVPGLALAALMYFTVHEPRRDRPPASDAPARPSLRTVTTTLWRQRSFRHLTIAQILLYTMGLGLSPWYAAFMIRSHGMSTSELGLWLGLIFSIGGLSGVVAGGYIVSRWFDGDERGQLRLSALTVGALVPFFVAFLLLPNSTAALLTLLPLIALFSTYLGPTYALMQRLVADDMRATMLSLVMLFANLIGMGVGPQVVGILSDVLRPRFGADSLRYAMLAMSFVALWSAFHFWKSARTVKEDLALIEEGAAARAS